MLMVSDPIRNKVYTDYGIFKRKKCTNDRLQSRNHLKYKYGNRTILAEVIHM